MLNKRFKLQRILRTQIRWKLGSIKVPNIIRLMSLAKRGRQEGENVLMMMPAPSSMMRKKLDE